LLLVGDGPERRKIEDESIALGISHLCIFPGWVDRRTVYELLHALDVFVLPSLFEGLSSSLVQAMGIGLPVIASDIPSHREIIKDGFTGLLYPTRNVHILSSKIEQLLDNKCLREVLGRNAKLFVKEKIDIKSVVEEYSRIYHEILVKNTKNNET
jgi:glycosyltransferase involved in cell wall biosynthesis